jgi:hypothetical protein
MLARCARGACSALSAHRALALVVSGGGGRAGGERGGGGGATAMRNAKTEKTLRRLRCAMRDNVIMNGAVFLCSIFLVEWLVQPGLARAASGAAARFGVGAAAQAFAAGFGRFVYCVLWLLPLYLLCLVMNGAHVAEIAEHSFTLLRQESRGAGGAAAAAAAASSVSSAARPRSSASSAGNFCSDKQPEAGLGPSSAAAAAPSFQTTAISSSSSSSASSASIATAPIGEFLGDVFYDTVVVMTCFGTVGCVDLLTAASPWMCHRLADLCVMAGSAPLDRLFRYQLSAVLPVLGTGVSFVYVCWLYSFWAFNARWKFEGIGIVARLRKIETDWAFYLGFGAPLAAVTFNNPFFINAAVYALAFPWLVILASGADTTVKRGRSTTTPSRIHIFRVSKMAFERLRRWMLAATSSGKKAP